MSSGRYRTVFHTALTPADAFSTAAREFRAWLAKKSERQPIDMAAFDAGQARLGGSVVLLRSSTSGGDGTQTSQWQLRELKDGGYWLSSLLVHAEAKAHTEPRTWFWLDVEHVRTAGHQEEEVGRPMQASVPNLARQLLAAVDAHDHWAQLSDKPTLIRPGRVEELLEVLCDEERRLPAVVASPHSRISFDDWKRIIEHVTRFLPGLASLYILDPIAADEFNEAVGSAYGVWGGAVRSYLPDLDLAIDDDSARHRVLSGPRIETDPHRSARLLAALPRQLAADGRLPKPLKNLSRMALASESSIAKSASSRMTGSSVDSVLLAENIKIRQENEELRDFFELAGYEERKLRDSMADLQDGLLDTTAELEAANQKIAELTDWVRVLRRRLEIAGSPAELFIPAETPTILPIHLPEVLERLDEFDRVRFTGDIDLVWKLEEKAQSSTWAQTTWRVLLAMQDYAIATSEGRFRGDFLRWCKEPIDGAVVIPAGKVKPDESETVHNNTKMRRQRELPVPVEVNPSGRVFMGAHIHIGGGAGMSAPRLHFYDDVRRTGKIYIGYLGPHLDVKSTN